MKRELREKFDEAVNIFSPDRLFLSLKRDENGTVYYDRDATPGDEREETQFFYVLDQYYQAGYKDIVHLTMYFEVLEDVIIAGGYNLRTKEKTSRRRLISTDNSTPFTYAQNKMEYVKKIINNT